MIKKLASHLGEYKNAALVTPFLSALEAIMDVLLPLLMSYIIDQGIEKGDMNAVLKYGLLTFLVALFALFLGLTAGRMAAKASAGYAAARAQAQLEIASMLETKVAAGMQGKLDNAQGSAIDATTVDKFNQRSKAIFNNTLSNMTTVLHIYRVLPNNNYQVQVRIAYDKKVMQAKLKRQLQEQLEKEGDEFGEEVDDIIDNALKEI